MRTPQGAANATQNQRARNHRNRGAAKTNTKQTSTNETTATTEWLTQHRTPTKQTKTNETTATAARPRATPSASQTNLTNETTATKERQQLARIGKRVVISLMRGAATRAGPAGPPLGRLDFGGAPEPFLRNSPALRPSISEPGGGRPPEQPEFPRIERDSLSRGSVRWRLPPLLLRKMRSAAPGDQLGF